MLINQISIFCENHPGKLAEIITKVSGSGVDIRALSIADTSDFGILRLIVNDPERTLKVLKEENITVAVTEVIAVKLDDKPGSLSLVLNLLSQNGISVEYAYAFITRKSDYACVILRVEDNAAAIKALQDGGLDLLKSDEIYGL